MSCQISHWKGLVAPAPRKECCQQVAFSGQPPQGLCQPQRATSPKAVVPLRGHPIRGMMAVGEGRPGPLGQWCARASFHGRGGLSVHILSSMFNDVTSRA